MPASPDLLAALGGPVHLVAPRLLGAALSCGGVTLILTEVEAYGGSDDPGSHAFRGPTPRNRSMYLTRGHAYVYFIYGTSFMLNISSGPEGQGAAVLIRALEPLSGIPHMERNRGSARLKDLMRGPGRLARAMAIDRDRKSTRLNSSHTDISRMPSSA